MAVIKIITYILDDDPSVLDIFELLLDVSKIFDITYFNNPDEFTKSISNKVHLAVLDINIPGYNYNVLNTIEYIQSNYPGIYIIVISGFLDVDIMKKFIQLGVFDAVEKGGSAMWIEDLRKSLERVTHKITSKLEAVA